MRIKGHHRYTIALIKANHFRFTLNLNKFHDLHITRTQDYIQLVCFEAIKNRSLYQVPWGDGLSFANEVKLISHPSHHLNSERHGNTFEPPDVSGGIGICTV